jgi:hypothetical protein
MKRFFYKAGIALFAITISHNLNAANNDGILNDLQQSANSPATLPFSPMVFNFSNELATATSVAGAMSQLIAAKSAGTLNPVQLPYFVSEIFAGYVRANPSRCADLVPHISEPQNIYRAWGGALSTIRVVDRELSALASFTTAIPFVHGVVENDMPIILKALGVADAKLQEVHGLLQGLEPLITPTICLAYATASATVAAGARIAAQIEELDLATCCGCFGKKPSKKLAIAANMARSIGGAGASADPFA